MPLGRPSVDDMQAPAPLVSTSATGIQAGAYAHFLQHPRRLSKEKQHMEIGNGAKGKEYRTAGMGFGIGAGTGYHDQRGRYRETAEKWGQDLGIGLEGWDAKGVLRVCYACIS